MNLFIEDLAGYVIREWDSTLTVPSGSKEARFIVQSLDPEGTLALFQALEEHRKAWAAHTELACYFRVAKGLWNAWGEAIGDSATTQTMQDLLDRGWIDMDDKLPRYRNRTVQDEQVDGLVIVLVGLNHATDQGSLADFHRVDEHRLLSQLNGSFQPWLQKISVRLGVSPSETELQRLDAALRQLFELRPLRLAKLADFLLPLVDQGDCYHLEEFRGRVFKALPYWDIPPLLPDGHGNLVTGPDAVKALKAADAFISHQDFKTKVGQSKALKKIEEALVDTAFVLPLDADGNTEFTGVDAYRDCVKVFIEQADPAARTRLLRVDFTPLFKALDRKEDNREKGPSPRKLSAFGGLSFHALLSGVWDALLEFESDDSGREPMWQRLAGIKVELEAFHHDLSGDDRDGVGVKELSEKLLRGCLGGMDRLFADMDLKLPLNAEQLKQPPSQWERQIDIDLGLGLGELKIAAVRGSARPFVQFRVSIADVDPAIVVKRPYRWYLDATQAERVRHACAERVYGIWNDQTPNPDRVLPAFRIDRVDLTALSFAADADEANRLLAQALSSLHLVDLREGLATEDMAPTLREATNKLIACSRQWLDACVRHGYYNALLDNLSMVLHTYDNLGRMVLDDGLIGAPELLRRLYKAFLLIDDQSAPNDAYLPAAVVWGLSPSVLELSLAQSRFLADGFPETVTELALEGKSKGKAAFEKLLELSRIQRPMTALVTDATGHLSTKSRSFGLVHCLGEVPDSAKSLAVQTLLKESDSNDDEDVRELIQPCEEKEVVRRVLALYSELHPYARDGLRILAANVRELPTILSGVDAYLKQALKVDTGDRDASDLPPFYCTVMVYSTSSSPLAMENGLALWRDRIVESYRGADRGLELTVGHRFAPKMQIRELLRQERRRYDVAFLFHFLRTAMDGRVDPAAPFSMGQDGRGGYFPIAEYPRPIRSGDRDRRQMLLSNRRLRIQTRHSDLSARLSKGGHENVDFVVYGQVDFAPWVDIVQEMHRQSQWVACVDSFVDKWLLGSTNTAGGSSGSLAARRKIVGFESGLGAYGELNLTISTEQDTLEELADRLANELPGLLPHQQPTGFDTIAERIVVDAEAIIGLASLRAVLGKGEKLREVIGFAAIRRLLKAPDSAMSQLLPLDALQHWFEDAETNHRADLLALTLQVRPDQIPLVHASVLECKLAGHNSVIKAEALTQVCKVLRHLTMLFAPRMAGDGFRSFDRRYWWAQLHRAIASRAMVTLPDRDLRLLDQALESLAEGRFEICWRGVIFSFWTNVPMRDPAVTALKPSEPVTHRPLPTPPGFVVQHFELGYEGLAALFEKPEHKADFSPDGPAICLQPGESRPRPSDAGSEGSGTGHRSAVAESAQSGNAAPAADESSLDTTGPPVAESADRVTRQAPTTALDQVLLPPTESAERVAPAGSATPEAGANLNPPASSRPAIDTGVAQTDTQQDSRLIQAVEPKLAIPERILIGTRTSGEPAYWHFGHPQLPNRHLLIFGTSGSGKTYGIQCLLAEMACSGLRSLIVDYTDGFLPAQMEERFKALARPLNHFVRTERLPLNPFRRQRQVLDPSLPEIEEGSYEVATRIQSIFASVFDMGDQQSAALVRSLQSGLDLDPTFSLDKLLPRLRDDSAQGESLANKLEPLIQSRPFREGVESAWSGMLASRDNSVHVLQLAGLAREIQKLVTEFVLWDLWDFAQSTGKKDRPIPIVLDEIQNLDHSSDSPIDKMLREGRKFGVALMLATQTTSQFNQEQRDRLFQAGHKLFFKPATTETDRFAQILSQTTSGISKSEWAQRLAKLEKGQCWSLGPVLRPDGTFKDEAVLVSVTSLENRRFEG